MIVDAVRRQHDEDERQWRENLRLDALLRPLVDRTIESDFRADRKRLISATAARYILADIARRAYQQGYADGRAAGDGDATGGR
jgi:hypothetical protein